MRRVSPDPLDLRRTTTLHPVAPVGAGMAPANPQGLVLVGSMRWWVKRASAEWFRHRVFDRVAADCPDLTLTVAGTEASRLGWVEPRIQIPSDIDDVADVYACGGIAIVPERQSGGVKLKTLEAAAWGLPILATTAGGEATGLRPGVDLLSGDSADELAALLTRLLDAPGVQHDLGRSAFERLASLRRLFEPDTDWSRTVRMVHDALNGDE